jgi:glycosyltransferase involved in cell wall biosynthesis
MAIKEKKLVVAFIDWVIPKNKVQIDAIHQLGHLAAFFVNNYNQSAASYFREGDFYVPLETNFLKRLKQIFLFLKIKRNVIHHLEVYPGGRFSFIYILLSKVFGIRTICVERGDLHYYNPNGYGLFVRISMWVCYKYADVIWYREPYMAGLLKKIRVREIFFIHNAIHRSNITPRTKTIDFLWVNRLTPERKSEWFIDILNKKEFHSSSSVLAGVLENTLYNKQQDYVLHNKPPSLQVLDYVTNPNDLYASAKFFVLPADFVFANNALLESMSLGVVPLIARQEGSEIIVDDGLNGFIFDYDKESLEEAMLIAMKMPEDQYKLMSDAAVEKVREVFSVEKFTSQLAELYKKMEE